MESEAGKYFRKKRSSTVEPVIGSLLDCNNMRKILTKGLQQANKVMLGAAISYNLKKLMKWTMRKEKQAMTLIGKTINNKVADFKNIYLRIRTVYCSSQQAFLYPLSLRIAIGVTQNSNVYYTI